jgi:hypothetical protein
MNDPTTWEWWTLANDRRQLLIYRKHFLNDLTLDEEAEITLLQKVAELIVDSVSPGRVTTDRRTSE